MTHFSQNSPLKGIYVVREFKPDKLSDTQILSFNSDNAIFALQIAATRRNVTGDEQDNKGVTIDIYTTYTVTDRTIYCNESTRQ